MADKPGFSVATGFQGGVTVGIAADTWSEFVQLCADAFGEGGPEIASGLYAALQAQSLVGHETLLQVTARQFGGGAVQPAVQQQVPPAADPWGNPPVPAFAPNTAPPQTAPPQGPPPGQFCDPRDPEKTKYVAAGVSKAGKPYGAFWTYPNGHPKAR